jgi:hypothetical protein
MSRAVLVALVLVLAGCSVPSLPFSPDSAATEDVEPWAETEFVVAVEANESFAKHERAVRNATRYWEREGERYLGHPVAFRVAPNASDPDIVVRAVAAITDCGAQDHAAGCAPYAEDLRRRSDPATVRIKTGFDLPSTSQVTRHEFGHLLGLEHDDEPQAIMASRTVLATTAKRNVTERPLPWQSPTLTVYVDESTVDPADRSTVREQVDHAITYYNEGADGSVPANVTFTRVDDPATADVQVSFPTTLPCGETPGSCARLSGLDPDDDGALEWYTAASIYVGGVESRQVGWHVGRWFGSALGADDDADLPEPFRDAPYHDDRRDWWD